MSKKFDYDMIKEYIKNFDYNLLSTEYINTHTNLYLKCPNDHEFEMTFNNFKKGQRCPVCARKNQNRKPKKPNNKKHSNEYIQSLVESRGYKLLEPYVNKRTKLKLECPNGHYHEIRLDSFQNGSGCKECMRERMTNDLNFVKRNIKNKGFELIGDYTSSHNKTKFKCNKGHTFISSYDHIVNGCSSCPICSGSSGEQRISNFLESKNIDFIPQFRFDDCKYYNQLPFDFYIPSMNILIEYDGELHYKVIDHFGGIDRYLEGKLRDEIKDKYCNENNIKLIRIPYWEKDNIELILENELIKYE